MKTIFPWLQVELAAPRQALHQNIDFARIAAILADRSLFALINLLG
jgi:hypothetical protein